MIQDQNILSDVTEEILAALNEAEDKTRNADSVEEMKNIANKLKSKAPNWKSRINC